MGRFFGGVSKEGLDASLQTEINSKMASVLEDTLLKNVQLQSDMELMSNEIARLENELKQSKSQTPTQQ